MNGEVYPALIIPKLLKFAREYFNCPTLEGIPLENMKSSGSYASHWEKQFFPTEYMNPSIENPGIITEFTMKYLEAMGWYSYKPGNWQRYAWGKDEGCQFFQSKCQSQRLDRRRNLQFLREEVGTTRKGVTSP